jgi:shikimate dehydrogenase
MTEPTPLVIVSASGRSIAAVRRQVEEARGAGADVVEVRIDRLAEPERERLGELFPSAVPLLATLRSRGEGGEGPDDPTTRARLLAHALSLPFGFVDLEWERDRALDLTPPGPEGPVRLYSSHLSGANVRSAWERRLAELATANGLGKLVFPCSVGGMFEEVLPRLPPLADGSVSVFTTGASGALLRAWSHRLGMPVVFAALPETADTDRSDPVEPSQIPVDRLLPFLRAGGRAPLFAVVGRPIAHSLSPRLHHRWMRATGRVGLYVAIELTDEEEFLGSLGPLAEQGLQGVNVTQPFKEPAFAAATQIGKGAEACRAANCLTFRDGELEAENTDLAAALRRLGELRSSGRWDGGPFAVVGAGGAARATLAAARLLGTEVTIFARRPEAAHTLAREFGAVAGALHEARPFPLVVHATNAGRGAERSLGVPLERLLSRGSYVLDWVYAPDHPDVRNRTELAGATYENGARLLVYQAAESFALWWGEELPAGEVERALEEVDACAE